MAIYNERGGKTSSKICRQAKNKKRKRKQRKKQSNAEQDKANQRKYEGGKLNQAKERSLIAKKT